MGHLPGVHFYHAQGNLVEAKNIEACAIGMENQGLERFEGGTQAITVADTRYALLARHGHHIERGQIQGAQHEVSIIAYHNVALRRM